MHDVKNTKYSFHRTHTHAQILPVLPRIHAFIALYALFYVVMGMVTMNLMSYKIVIVCDHEEVEPK